MNKIIIGVIIFIVILIGLFFYLKNSCEQGKYFSTSNFKCIECTTCSTNSLGIPTQWYKPGESCKGFTDRKCYNYSMPECTAGERTLLGTATSDRKCESISDCYVDCGRGRYATGEENCWSARGGSMICNDCIECNEDEIDISEESCSGRDNSNIDGLRSKIVSSGNESYWVPISCEGNIDRVCLKRNYIKYNDNINYSLLFHSQDATKINSLSSIPIDISNETLYYDSSKPENKINTINNNYNWNTVSILDLNNSRSNVLVSQWKIMPANLDNKIFNNCPIENNDVIYFYKEFDNQNDLILCVINDNNKYHIGVIKVLKNEHTFSSISTIRNKIYKNFRIENLTNFSRNILVSNDNNVNNKYFKLHLLTNNVRDNNTNHYLGYQYLQHNQSSIVKIYNINDIPNENNIKINFKKY